MQLGSKWYPSDGYRDNHIHASNTEYSQEKQILIHSTKIMAYGKGSITDTFCIKLFLCQAMQNTFKSMNHDI